MYLIGILIFFEKLIPNQKYLIIQEGNG